MISSVSFSMTVQRRAKPVEYLKQAMGILLSPVNDVASQQTRSWILDLSSATAVDAVTELEQRGVELRSTFGASDGQGATLPTPVAERSRS